jgi:hypothetical protein
MLIDKENTRDKVTKEDIIARIDPDYYGYGDEDNEQLLSFEKSLCTNGKSFFI